MRLIILRLEKFGFQFQVDENAVLLRKVDASCSSSPTTGRMPLPSLPVLSAISCSTQSPKLAMEGESTKVSLSRPCFGQFTHGSPQQGSRVLICMGYLRLQACISLHCILQQSFKVNAQQGGRHQPEMREGRIAPADIGVIQKDVPEVELFGDLLPVCCPGR